jgi:hypothetical protein
LVVNVEATTERSITASYNRRSDRCEGTLGKKPKQIVADGDYSNHASVPQEVR